MVRVKTYMSKLLSLLHADSRLRSFVSLMLNITTKEKKNTHTKQTIEQASAECENKWPNLMK